MGARPIKDNIQTTGFSVKARTHMPIIAGTVLESVLESADSYIQLACPSVNIINIYADSM